MTLRDVRRATGGRILRGASDLAIAGVSTNSKTLRPGQLFIALHGEHHDAHRFLPDAARAGAAAAVVHKKDAAHDLPGLPLVLVDNTTRALGDLALWHRKHCPTTVIGITGSNGKTTTKDMLYHILSGVVTCVRSRASFNNAVGVPLTLLEVRPGDAYTVVEMGTNSPGEIARLCEIADPDIGLITNVTETHLEGLGTLEGIAREKSALLKHTARRGLALYNADNYWTRRIARSIKGNLSSFGAENEADCRMFNLMADRTGISFKVVNGPRIHIPILGLHNAMNALAAVAVARRLGIDWGTITGRLATFTLPDMRMQAQTCRGVILINDAYNANPVSVEAAARTLRHMECSGKRILVLADMLELGAHASESHRKLGKTIAGFRFDYLFGLGARAAELLAAASKHGMKKDDLYLADSHEALAAALLRLVGPGDAVLFKGSRGMLLEEALRLVRDGLGSLGQVPPPQTETATAAVSNDNATGSPEPAPAAHIADAEAVIARADGGVLL